MLFGHHNYTGTPSAATQFSPITAVTNSGQPSHGCPPSPKLPRCWLVVLWAVVRVGESVPSHTPSAEPSLTQLTGCAWTTTGIISLRDCHIFLHFSYCADLRSKERTQTTSAMVMVPGRPSPLRSAHSGSTC